MMLYCGDCTSILKEVASDSVDLVIADPPYLTTKESWDKEEAFTSAVVDDLYRVIKDSGSLYVWCGIGEKSQSLIRWFPLVTSKFFFKDLITWKKSRGIGMRKGWLYTREEIIWAVKDNKKFTWNLDAQYGEEPNQFKVGFSGYACKSKFKRLSNVWTDIPEVLGSKGIEHFTPKPTKALERIILAHTKEGDVVLDPFMGSGSTGVACKILGREFIGIEIDENYFNIAEERIERATG